MKLASNNRGNRQTRTYDRADSIVFLKTNEQFGGLSNMAGGFPLLVNGIRILTSEALYQACRFPHRPEVQELIIRQTSPMTAKMKSKPYRHDSRPDWNQVRIKIMRWCLRVKLAQNWGAFGNLLLETGDRPIVEESRKDDFWGAKPVDERTLVGMNVLGRLLMELREAIKAVGRESLLRVEPIGIPNFLLVGGPIETVTAQGGEATAPIAKPVEHPLRVDARKPTAVQGSLFDPPAAKESSSPLFAGESSKSASIAHVKTFPDYKESGVPWLGKVPKHWELKRGKWLFRHRKEINAHHTHTNILSLTLRGVVNNDPDDPEGLVPKDYATYQFFANGDLVFKLIDLENLRTSRVGLVHEDGIMSSAYVRLVPRHSGVQRFFYHQYFDLYQRGIFNQLGAGVRSTLGPSDLLNVGILVPSADEQSAIVRFLDYMDRRIRRYIRAKQKLIKLLEEQKQAIIHRAVTRGLDPNVRLKPSGVGWLGDVPEHWEVRKLGQIAVSFCTGPFGSILHQSDYVEGGTPVINPTHMSRGRIVEDTRCSVPSKVADRLINYRLERHDLIFSRRGELGRCALVRDREAGWLCGTGSIRVRVAYDDIEPEYLIQSLQVRWIGEYLSLFSVGAIMDSLNTGILKGVPVLVPPINEQRALLARFAEEGRRIDSASAGAKHEIDLLREYRTRLIADVVTGKLDVREAAGHLPEEVEESEPLEEAEALGDGNEEGEGADLDAATEEAEA